jgi:hypothetical protein
MHYTYNETSKKLNLINLKTKRGDQMESSRDIARLHVEEVLSGRRDVNQPYEDGSYLMHRLIEHNLGDLVKKLLSLETQQVDLQAKNQDGKTPLQFARDLKNEWAAQEKIERAAEDARIAALPREEREKEKQEDVYNPPHVRMSEVVRAIEGEIARRRGAVSAPVQNVQKTNEPEVAAPKQPRKLSKAGVELMAMQERLQTSGRLIDATYNALPNIDNPATKQNTQRILAAKLEEWADLFSEYNAKLIAFKNKKSAGKDERDFILHENNRVISPLMTITSYRSTMDTEIPAAGTRVPIEDLQIKAMKERQERLQNPASAREVYSAGAVNEKAYLDAVSRAYDEHAQAAAQSPAPARSVKDMLSVLKKNPARSRSSSEDVARAPERAPVRRGTISAPGQLESQPEPAKPAAPSVANSNHDKPSADKKDEQRDSGPRSPGMRK